MTYHDLLLRDSARNRAFRRALAARVIPGASVLDIGSGTGLWAIEAARLGASRVVAIEKEPLLVSLIERLAAENGVADRVRVVRGDSPPRALVRIRLGAGPPRLRPDLNRLRGRWRVRDARAIDAFMVWVEMELAPGIRLSTRSGTSWSPALYGVESLGTGTGTAEFRLSLAGKESRWQVELETTRARVERSYSPLFAYGSLRSGRPLA